MRKIALAVLILVLAACNRQASEAPSKQGEATPVPAAPVKANNPAKPRPTMDLKSPLPEDFVLPFQYRRLYDNSVRTKDGEPQRRIMIEFIGLDAKGAEEALTKALIVKGFSAPEQQPVGDLRELNYTRSDGAKVAIKIDANPKRLLDPGAQGTLHLVWSSAAAEPGAARH